jgi:hypothetical protein
MKTKLLGLIAGMALLGVSQAGAATLVGTTTDATGIDGLVVDGTTYNLTFSDASYNSVYASSAPTFLGNFSGAIDASIALAAALNDLNVLTLTGLVNTVEAAWIPYIHTYPTDPTAVFSTLAVCNPCLLAGGWSNAMNLSDVYDDDLPSGDINVDYVVFSATPIPAALPLFATGLGAMGLLGWRRKRKNAGVIAAA